MSDPVFARAIDLYEQLHGVLLHAIQRMPLTTEQRLRLALETNSIRKELAALIPPKGGV